MNKEEFIRKYGEDYWTELKVTEICQDTSKVWCSEPLDC